MEGKVKFSILFGAGAENLFDLPLGSEYTKQTILTYNSKLLSALELYYKNNVNQLNENYCSRYYKEKLFNKNSITFREMIYKTLIYINDNELFDNLNITENISFIDANKKDEFVKFCDDIYDIIVNDFNKENNNVEKYHKIIDNIQYSGNIEKDFHTIINPNKLGIKKYWRIVNYYWNAFFTILIPILKKSNKYSNIFKLEENEYFYIINNIKTIISDLFGNNFLKECNNYFENKEKKPYYINLSIEGIKPNCILTSNYTPFVKLLNVDKTFYLAGKLSMFEIPNKLSVIDLSDNKKNLPKDNTFFPFLMTQSPIKPMICTAQYDEFYNANYELSKCKYLYILGYNINSNDNHINSILHEFICKNNKKIIYFYYVRKNEIFDEEKALNEINKSLKIKNNAYDIKIDIVELRDDPNIVIDRIRKDCY